MTGRHLVITLRWLSFLFVYLIWSTTPDWPPWLVQPFIAVAATIVAVYVIRSCPYFKAITNLAGWTTSVHRLKLHLLYPVLLALALVFLTKLLERVTYIALQVAFFGGLMHGCFHAWRHPGLCDRALRNNTPHFVHRVL